MKEFESVAFGLNRGRPLLRNAWGARGIVDSQTRTPVFGLVLNRQGFISESDKKEGPREILVLYNERSDEIQKGALAAFFGQRLDTRKYRPSTEIFRDEKLVVMANCNASHGYIYLVAFRPFDDVGWPDVGECNRKVCDSPAHHHAVHRDSGALYCVNCAKRINTSCGETVVWMPPDIT